MALESSPKPKALVSKDRRRREAIYGNIVRKARSRGISIADALSLSGLDSDPDASGLGDLPLPALKRSAPSPHYRPVSYDPAQITVSSPPTRQGAAERALQRARDYRLTRLLPSQLGPDYPELTTYLTPAELAARTDHPPRRTY